MSFDKVSPCQVVMTLTYRRHVVCRVVAQSKVVNSRWSHVKTRTCPELRRQTCRSLYKSRNTTNHCNNVRLVLKQRALAWLNTLDSVTGLA